MGSSFAGAHGGQDIQGDVCSAAYRSILIRHLLFAKFVVAPASADLEIYRSTLIALCWGSQHAALSKQSNWNPFTKGTIQILFSSCL